MQNLHFVFPTDIEPPVVTCPDNIYSRASRVVNWSTMPTATDNVDGNITFITCIDHNNHQAVSGWVYRVGITEVTCTTRDSASNQGMCTFNITTLPGNWDNKNQPLKTVDTIGKLLTIIISIQPYLVTSNGERLVVYKYWLLRALWLKLWLPRWSPERYIFPLLSDPFSYCCWSFFFKLTKRNTI